MKILSFCVFFSFFLLRFFFFFCLLWFLRQMSETCHLPERARDFFLFFISFFFLSFFFLPSRDSCTKRPGWHGLSGFSGTQVVFDWRLAHGPRPWRESATLGATVRAHPPDCNITMATEAKWMVGCVFCFLNIIPHFLPKIEGWRWTLSDETEENKASRRQCGLNYHFNVSLLIWTLCCESSLMENVKQGFLCSIKTYSMY